MQRNADVLGDDLLSGRLLAVALLRRICAVRRGGAAAAVAVATETHVFVLLFRRNRLSVLLTHGWEARRRLAEKNERSARRWESGGKSAVSAKHALSFGAQPRSERTEKVRSAHGFIVRWAVHPRARSGTEKTTCIRIQRPRMGRIVQVIQLSHMIYVVEFADDPAL